MRYKNRTLIVSQSRISEAEGRVARQRQVVERLEKDHHPADNAVALLLVMEQSLISMKRFLTTLERDLERALGVAEKTQRQRISRRRVKSSTNRIGRQVVDTLRSGGLEADQVPVSTAPKPRE